MTQTNRDTKSRRDIRLKLDIPPTWTTPFDDLISQKSNVTSMYVRVRDAAVATSVQKLLLESSHAFQNGSACNVAAKCVVKAIYRIESWLQYQAYQHNKRTMKASWARFGIKPQPVAEQIGCTTLPGHCNALNSGIPLQTDVNEMLLFHGTKWDRSDGIISSGFDFRKSRRCMYGDGAYFASQFCKAHQYTCPKKKNACNTACSCGGERTLVLAWVTVGDPYYTRETREGQRCPPDRTNFAGVSHGMYDSVVANPGPKKHRGNQEHQQVHQEFTIFNLSQAYPAYVVQYEVQ